MRERLRNGLGGKHTAHHKELAMNINCISAVGRRAQPRPETSTAEEVAR